jgi:hypothetical protein
MDFDCNFGQPLINYECDSWEYILIDSDANILDGLYLLHISTFRHYIDRTLNECHQLIGSDAGKYGWSVPESWPCNC